MTFSRVAPCICSCWGRFSVRATAEVYGAHVCVALLGWGWFRMV